MALNNFAHLHNNRSTWSFSIDGPPSDWELLPRGAGDGRLLDRQTSNVKLSAGPAIHCWRMMWWARVNQKEEDMGNSVCLWPLSKRLPFVSGT